MAENVVELSTDNFEGEVLGSKVPVLVDFWAPWCRPCLAIAPAVEQLAEQYTKVAKVAKVDIEKHPSVAQRFGVMSIPTLLVFKNGQPFRQIVGAVPKGDIENALQEALNQTA